jgi:hypothetical protein
MVTLRLPPIKLKFDEDPTGAKNPVFSGKLPPVAKNEVPPELNWIPFSG